MAGVVLTVGVLWAGAKWGKGAYGQTSWYQCSVDGRRVPCSSCTVTYADSGQMNFGCEVDCGGNAANCPSRGPFSIIGRWTACYRAGDQACTENSSDVYQTVPSGDLGGSPWSINAQENRNYSGTYPNKACGRVQVDVQIGIPGISVAGKVDNTGVDCPGVEPTPIPTIVPSCPTIDTQFWYNCASADPVPGCGGLQGWVNGQTVQNANPPRPFWMAVNCFVNNGTGVLGDAKIEISHNGQVFWEAEGASARGVYVGGDGAYSARCFQRSNPSCQNVDSFVLPSPTPTPTITNTPTPTFTPTPTPTVTNTPTPTPTGTISPTLTPTITNTPTATPTGTISPTPTPTSGSGSSTPNQCGGTCGSNSNCQGDQLFCFKPDPINRPNDGYCRSINCPLDNDCYCPGGTATTPAPVVGSTPKTGAESWLGGLVMMGLVGAGLRMYGLAKKYWA